MKYAITLASFRNIEPIEDTLATVARQGYDAVEMFGEPDEVDAKKLLDSMKSYGLHVCGVTGMWGSISSKGWMRKLLSNEPAIVRASEQYVIDCLRLCSILGGSEMNVCLFADDIRGNDRTHRIISAHEKENYATKAVPLMTHLTKKAEDYGIKLLLEPLNRYSTPYCATAKDALAIAMQVDSLGILLDTFHMNIEEDSFKGAIQSSSKYLKHLHFADNNRKMPGFAHIDFPSIVESLNEIGYDGYISFEPNIADRNYERATKYGLDLIKGIVDYKTNRNPH
ncbi:MAG TPA: sugar phosphate isomerase/epimerase family protein [Nitrososphaera sp.]|jgi:D-psicose/D-tagatose/L-ribulose 3-epimerase|nr:sugar phosphate isomerase/epimerase family protein [Nitrososphaera sp.]